ncbi:MAG: DUF6036 family nucleotidyltransferase [Thermoanaerobaculia bacterium]|jgi:hypothetical protein
MTRAELEHILRAAVAITGRREWVIVGSQAILGACPDAAAELLVSQEADIYSPEDEDASDLIDGTIGERSPFHETFGYYAHGVGPRTAVLPSGWRSRAVRVEGPATGGAVGLCPDPADLAISKLVAWREKDREFVAAILRHGIASPGELRSRTEELAAALGREVLERIARLTRS